MIHTKSAVVGGAAAVVVTAGILFFLRPGAEPSGKTPPSRAGIQGPLGYHSGETPAALKAIAASIKEFHQQLSPLPAPENIPREKVLEFIAAQKYSPEAFMGAAFYLNDPSLLREALERHPENTALWSMLLTMDFDSCGPEELAKFRGLNPDSPLPDFLRAAQLLKAGNGKDAMPLLARMSRTPVDLEFLRLSLSGEHKLYDAHAALPDGGQSFAMRTTTKLDLPRKLSRNLGQVVSELRALHTSDPALAMDAVAGAMSFTLSMGGGTVDLPQAKNALELEEILLRQLPDLPGELAARFETSTAAMLEQNAAEVRNMELLRLLETEIYKSGDPERFAEYRALCDQYGPTAALRRLAENPKYFTYLSNPVSGN